MKQEPSDRPGQAFITGASVFLPNRPVGNDEIEDILGLVGAMRSRTKTRVLRNNGITSRHYAIDRETRARSHTNAQMTAEAIRGLARSGTLSLDEIECLACGTSTPDQWIPSHGLMVHAELGCPPCESVTTAGVCASGMTALKYAYMSVIAGFARRAVATGSELASTLLRAAHFEPAPSPTILFEQDFLRWMLSDGAGAVLVMPEPRPTGISLRIDWIEVVSLASSIEPCMYWGAVKSEDGSLVGWRDAGSPDAAVRGGFFNLSQDVKLLGREVGPRLIEDAFQRVRARHPLAPGEVDWFLPHYSSEYFRQELHDRFVAIDFPIPFDRWFTNLATKGNTGSASIFIILEELMHSGRLEAGDRLLCFVPESARFTAVYALLTAVGPEGGRAS